MACQDRRHYLQYQSVGGRLEICGLEQSLPLKYAGSHYLHLHKNSNKSLQDSITLIVTKTSQDVNNRQKPL